LIVIRGGVKSPAQGNLERAQADDEALLAFGLANG
jgi:hypothetical protein